MPDPLIVLVFDEAHDVSHDILSHDDFFPMGWSTFGELQRALEQLRQLPLFTLFISPAGRIRPVKPMSEKPHASSKKELQPLTIDEPWFLLPFDAFAVLDPSVIGGRYLRDFEDIRHLIKLGRPLYVLHVATLFLLGYLKLAQVLSPLSQR
jgi:hypothetical protein